MPQNILPPNDSDSSENHERQAAAVESLANRFSGPTLRENQNKEWDQDSVKYFESSVFTALRLKSQTKLDQAFDAFGGPPPQSDYFKGGIDWNATQLLFEAARDPNAFGFESILNAQQDEIKGQLPEYETATWLRGGLTNSVWNRSERYAYETDLIGRMALPIKSCFVRDNPVALAKILKDPKRFAALASFEPKPNEGLVAGSGSGYPESSDVALVSKARATNACYEISLLWEAIHRDAFRCAAFLAALPAFNQTITHPRGFAIGASADGRRGLTRRPQHAFEEDATGVEFSLFELAVCARVKNEKLSADSRSRFISSWLTMIESMVDHASPEAKAWKQEGTGMGWTEILFARREPLKWGDAASRGNNYAEREIAEFMNISARLEGAGFKPQWAVMAEASSTCTTLKEWMQLRGTTSSGPECFATKRKTISL